MPNTEYFACWRDCHDRFRFQFESMLANLSARFINLPVEQMDDAIVDAQRQVCECMGIDVCSLWRLSPDQPGTLLLSHYYSPPDFPPVALSMDASVHSPWCMDMMHKGKDVVVARVSQTPPEAERDRELWAYCGIKSLLTLPLSVGGGPAFAALNFCHTREEREWGTERIDRLRLVGQMLANALMRQQADRALRESQARLELATSAAEAGLWVLNGAGTSFWVNAKIMQLFGLPPGDEISVEKFFDLIHPDDRESMRVVLDNALRSQEMTTAEYRIIRPDREVRWMRSSGRMSIRSKGETARLSGITADITDRKHAEIEATDLRQELTHVARVYTLGELTSSMAHELNQPLGAIMRNAEAAELFLQDPSPDIKELEAILADIRHDAQRAGAVIDRVRSLMKRNKIDFRMHDFNLLASEDIELFRPDASMRRVRLTLATSPDAQLVLGDRVQLQQVLINLLSNAVDAVQDNPPENRLVRTEVRVEGESVLVSVSDNGPGIAPEYFQRLFEPFVTSKTKGMGLGLSICQSIIKAHDGRLWAENNPHGGATFYFSLPRRHGVPAT